jgi:hypothetical protein
MAASIYDYNYMTIFEGIWLYAYQAPTYHVILELLLVGWIVKLLFFSKQYNPEVKNTPTREVTIMIIHTSCILILLTGRRGTYKGLDTGAINPSMY